MRPLAPILIFAYNRLDTLQKSVENLKKNKLSADSELYVFSDAAKNQNNAEEVARVRDYIKSISGFKKIHLEFAAENRGLAKSIIYGASKIIDIHQKIIVLEDDIMVSSNFLDFMNQSLDYYEYNNKVFSVSGYSFPNITPSEYEWDVYFTPRGLSWGWATWKDRWKNIDWEVKDYSTFINDKKAILEFKKGGSDLFLMLNKQVKGQKDSWAIRWFYNQFKFSQLTVFPKVSKAQNEGFDERATHTNVYNRYKTILDQSGLHEFKFPEKVELNHFILKAFQKNYSLFTRIFWGRMMTYFQKATRYLK